MEIELPPLFSEFLKSLNDHGVDYLIIGGYAVGYHGYSRTTDDFDLWVRLRDEKATRIVAALTDFGFGVPELKAELFRKEDQIVRMGVPPNRIELMTTISGVTFDECWQGRMEDEWDGVPVAVIGLDCLRKNERATGRLKDLADLEQLPKP
jgi:hypothetical protein